MNKNDEDEMVGNNGIGEATTVGDDAMVSSDAGEGSAEMEEGSLQAGDEQLEDGFDVMTHGGGQLEDVESFDASNALLSVIGVDKPVVVDKELWNLPRSCDLEFQDVQETVCGEDGRVHITKISAIPWRMICQLIITRADGRKSRCTGWFISPRTVMTAGHCVFSHAGNGGWAQSIEVIPGMNDRLRPFGSATGSSFRSVRGWTKGSNKTHDYGCIVLPSDSPLGNKTGWFGFAKLSNASLKNLLTNNSGYPGDKPFGTQWYNAGRIGEVMSRQFSYMLDTAGGQSGSPTWRFSEGKRHAIGIHAYGGCPNKSTRITQPVYDNMMHWKSLGQ
jgi:glutamyl endopeptidase